MARQTTTQKNQLDRMNQASRKAGGIGTRIDALEFGTAATPSAGTLTGTSVLHYTLDIPYIGTNVKMHAATLLTTGVQTVSTSITNPDFPRILSVDGNDANVTGNVVFTGTDINDDALTETIALNGSTEVFGVKAFKTVTSYTVPVYAVAGTETVSVGMGDKFGFPVAVPNGSLVLAKSFDGSADAGTVTASATIPASIYAVAGTLDGAKAVELWFVAG